MKKPNACHVLSVAFLTAFVAFAETIHAQEVIELPVQSDIPDNAHDFNSTVVMACHAILEKVDVKQTEFKPDQLRAIQTIGLYRDQSATPELLRVVTLKKPKGPKIPGDPLRPVPFAIEQYPAAVALVSIGMPAVKLISGKIDSAGKIEQPRIQIYAEIIVRVLGPDHALRYIEFEKTKAIAATAERYDALIAALKKSAAAFPVAIPRKP